MLPESAAYITLLAVIANLSGSQSQKVEYHSAFIVSLRLPTHVTGSSPTITFMNNSGNEEWEGFNPFKRQIQSTVPMPSIPGSSTHSLRKILIQDLMNDLLENTEDDAILEKILSKNVDLLMEPLNADDALMDEDSIYSPEMTREERFKIYDQVMQQREKKAVNSSVKKVLSFMREFVMSRI